MLRSIWHQVTVRGCRQRWLHQLRFGYYALHVGFCLPLCVLLATLTPRLTPVTGRDVSAYAQEALAGCMHAWLWLQLLVTVAAGVPLVAEEIAQEKERGTLALLLTTPLAPWRIVVGTMVGRLIIEAQRFVKPDEAAPTHAEAN